ncbi:hypothetical protein VDGD_20496 [Verticillium dahliae]|nr:hypothetical protein VDGD_20496 [Verticillium dahliae]
MLQVPQGRGFQKQSLRDWLQGLVDQICAE